MNDIHPFFTDSFSTQGACRDDVRRGDGYIDLEVRRRKRYPCTLQPTSEVRMRRVTGVGGIFMSAKDPKALCDWYKKHLGIDVQDSTSQSTARGRLQRAREDRRLGVREIRMGHG